MLAQLRQANPADCIRPHHAAVQDQRRHGANKYVVHFERDELPPVEGFWSITMYDANYFFVLNPINRYSISARRNLKRNADDMIHGFFWMAGALDRGKELIAEMGNELRQRLGGS